MRIIWFDLDSLRPDHLGCYGYPRPTSPAIDAIACQGVRFEHVYCADSPCVPSRANTVSGRFGIRNGVISNLGAGARLRIRTTPYGGPVADNQTFPRQLRAHGHDTFSFSNFADRHSAWWFMSGWSEFHTPNLKGGAETAAEVNACVLPWLRRHAARDNYLLHINYWDAHRCYQMDSSWADRLRDTPAPDWPDEQAVAAHQSITGPFTAHGQFRDDRSPFPLMPGAVRSRLDFEHLITGYDAAIAYVDHHVGQVLDEVDRQGVLDEAAVIISADHGDAFGEHGIYSDHVCADECIHRVPLVIRWPGVTPPGAACESLLYSLDLPPTLCELLGMPVPEDWDGCSFAPQVRGGQGAERTHLVWGHGLYTVQRAVRTRDHLMVRTYDGHGYPFESVELYEMASDPYQTQNLRQTRPALVHQCDHLLAEWIAAQRARGPTGPDPVDLVLEERSRGVRG